MSSISCLEKSCILESHCLLFPTKHLIYERETLCDEETLKVFQNLIKSPTYSFLRGVTKP